MNVNAGFCGYCKMWVEIPARFEDKQKWFMAHLDVCEKVQAEKAKKVKTKDLNGN